MDLEKMAAQLRPRSNWEAVDLGNALLRRFWLPVYLSWVVTAAPVFVLLYGLLDPLYATMAMVWLLPLLGRVPLFVLSRAMFGATPNLAEVLRNLPRLWLRNLLMGLVVARLDPGRSFHQPVMELEGLSWDRFFKRCAVLNPGQTGIALLQTLGSWLIAAGLFWCLPMRHRIWLNEPFWFDLSSLVDATAGSSVDLVMSVALLFLVMTLVEPLYVAGGFAQYLNRRTQLEGWDIELLFRRLRNRLQNRRVHDGDGKKRRGSRARVGAVGLLLFGLCAAGLKAQEPPRPPDEVIQEVLRGEDFGHERTITRWRPIRRSTSRQPRTSSSGPGSGSGMGELFRVLMWMLGIGLLLWLVYMIITSRDSKAKKPGEDARVAPEVVHGLDVRPESLPADVPAAAWQLFVAGDAAGCLSLLYRGALAMLMQRYPLEITSASTEGDCLRAVRDQATEPRSHYFAELTSAWTSCAYAHRAPRAETAKELCESWGASFGGQA